MKDSQYFVVPGWVSNRLKLTGNSRDIYCIINGFSQDGAGEFTGSAAWLASALGISRRAVADILRKLTEDGLLIKRDVYEDGVKLCRYRCAETAQGYAESSYPPMQKVHTPYEETAHNNIDNNITTTDVVVYSNTASSKFDFAQQLIADGADRQAVADFMASRKAKRLANTRSAYDLLKREATAAGISVADAVAFAAGHSWAAFKAEWLHNAGRRSGEQRSVYERNAEAVADIQQYFAEINDQTQHDFAL